MNLIVLYGAYVITADQKLKLSDTIWNIVLKLESMWNLKRKTCQKCRNNLKAVKPLMNDEWTR